MVGTKNPFKGLNKDNKSGAFDINEIIETEKQPEAPTEEVSNPVETEVPDQPAEEDSAEAPIEENYRTPDETAAETAQKPAFVDSISTPMIENNSGAEDLDEPEPEPEPAEPEDEPEAEEPADLSEGIVLNNKPRKFGKKGIVAAISGGAVAVLAVVFLVSGVFKTDLPIDDQTAENGITDVTNNNSKSGLDDITEDDPLDYAQEEADVAADDVNGKGSGVSEVSTPDNEPSGVAGDTDDPDYLAQTSADSSDVDNAPITGYGF
ncbi:MAG: hypothetical protein LBL08_03645 [Candidatus Nomurabacteria bacterium]|jgi:hypothetical protein|nr:hypothetical protein [Candidatus Nomurabacteria bacterium]